MFNAQSIVNKAETVLRTMTDQSVDIAGICETWLTSLTNPTTAKIKSHGYSLLHSFRTNKRGGGTALLYKSCYSLSPFKVNKHIKTFEYTAASIKTSTGTKVMFTIIYRTGQLTSLFCHELDQFLSVIQPLCDCLIVAGDLNVHFEQLQIRPNKQVLDLFQSYGLERNVFEPTHIAGGSLDQIFTFTLHKQLKCKVSVDSSRSLPSDHFPVYCELSLSFEHKYFKEITYRKLSYTNTVKFTEDLQAILDNLDVNSFTFQQSMIVLNQRCEDLLNTHAPLQTRNVSTIDSAPWFDKEYRELRKLRRRAEYRMKKPGSTLEDRIAFKDACSKCTIIANAKKKDHFKNIISKADNKPHALYKLVNQALDRNQVKPLPNYTENLENLAKDFNSYFTQKITNIRDNIKNHPVLDSFQSESLPEFPQMKLMFDFQPTTIQEIKEIISEVGIKCSPADLLPQTIFKENLEILLPIIVELVNKSLSSGNIDGIKLADIIPLLKRDSLDPNILKNFRPVSNLTFIGKLIERVVLKQLNEHLKRNNLDCNEQSAYKQNHSTETLLIRIWNDLLVASDERSATVLIMLDLSAAFDTVDHDLLLKILRYEIGLRGRVLLWFTSFLKGRAQRIRLGCITSEECIIKFGVPQGSVLGPVLFNIYIRSIYVYVKKLGFNIMGYADDHQVMKIFKPSAQGVVLTFDIERCFSSIKEWMSYYYLQMNDSKTEIIVFGPSRVLSEIQIKGVNISSNTSLRFVNSVKNLGIHMDNALTMERQVIELKKKCFYTLRNITKIRFLLSTEQRKTIVNSLVVSCLDYCNGLYFGISEKLMSQLQTLQNACAKTVVGKYKYDHVGNDLHNLHWLSIKKRVIFKIALLSYKALNGIAPLYLQELFKYCHHGHSLKLMVPYNHCLKNFSGRSFSVVGPKLINSLPSHITKCDSVTSFKASLKTFLFNLPNYEVDKLFKR